jgi:subtilisin family serine protease
VPYAWVTGVLLFSIGFLAVVVFSLKERPATVATTTRTEKAVPSISPEPSAAQPARTARPTENAPAAVAPVLRTIAINQTPDLRCRNLGRLSSRLYRCGETLVLLKQGIAFPEDLKSSPWPVALAALKDRGLMGGTLSSEKGDIALTAVPNDPKFSTQGEINASAAYDIGAEDVWNSYTGDPNMVVAVLDSGIDLAHPDLQANLWTNTAEIPNNGVDDDGNGYIDDAYGYNFFDSTSDVRDGLGHGTHGAGVIGAVGNNGVGVTGINWNVKIMALKITDDKGVASLAAALEAFNYAIANHARVINASWVMSLPTPDKVSLLQAAVQGAIDGGAVVVAAAGNGFESGGQDNDASPLYPASLNLPGLISVASVDPDATLSNFSNYGAASVNLAAPGSGITSTFLGGDYAATMGTSVAASVVSGASALLLSAKPSLSPAEVKSLFTSNVKPESGLSGKVASGGILSLPNALSAAGVALETSPPVASASEPKSEAKAPSSGGGCSLLDLH